MSTWYRKILGDHNTAQEEIIGLLDKISAISMAGNSLGEMFVFSVYDHENDASVAYFPPSSQKIAEMVNALPCKKPAPHSEDSVTVIFGDEEKCRQELFPACGSQSSSGDPETAPWSRTCNG